MFKLRIPSKLPVKIILLILVVFLSGAVIGQKFNFNASNIFKAKIEKNTPKAFISEVYDKIKDNYWDKVPESSLLELFQLSIAKNGKSTSNAKIDNKEQLLAALTKAMEGMSPEQKNTFVVSVAGTALASLAPQGRSGLYTTKQQQQLKNTVENVNPEKDLYKDLGLQKGASVAAVQQAYQKEAEKLAQDKSPEAKEKIKQISYAKDTLSQDNTKTNYDQKQVEPTIFTKILTPNILYMQFKKFSPTSLDEFRVAFDSYKDNQSLSALIFDLRGNIGGAIDSTAYFMGYFLGRNQNAFDFYHKGDFQPFRTPTDKLASLSKFKQIVVLIDNQTQSSAEMMAASLKKYHLGVVLGVPTKGWGTVESVFPLENQISQTEKYSVFLVHSITLRDDNQPIEGRGVDPDISIKDPNWQQQLLKYFNNPALNESVGLLLR